MLLKKSKLNKIVLVFLSLAFLICLIWFKDGKQKAAGEESFSIFNRGNVLALNAIWEDVGSGYPNPTYLTRIPISYAVGFFRQTGLPLYFIQAATFFILLFTGMYGMYLLAETLVPKSKINFNIGLIAGLFYLLNTYVVFQIWNRFLYSSMFIWALMPLAIYYWYKFLSTKPSYLLHFIVITLLLCLAYLQPAHIITFWVPLGLTSLFLIYKSKNKLGTFLKSILGFIIWPLCHLWWIYPYFKLNGTAFSEVSNLKANIDSLVSVSKYFNSDQIVTLRQGFIFGQESQWYQHYSQPLVILSSLLILIIVVLGSINIYKKNNGQLILLIAFVGWFVSKGANWPLGLSAFTFLFDKIPQMAVFRNPYEKFGLVFVVAYSILFAIGLVKLPKFFRWAVIFCSFILLMYPLWNGKVMVNKSVSIPNYYNELSDFIDSDQYAVRILHLPPSPGDSVVYEWGYTGIEPSEFLLPRNNISKILRAKYYDDKYLNMINDYRSGKEFEKSLEDLGITHVVLHMDIAPYAQWVNPQYAQEVLSSSPRFHLIKSFGKLNYYSFDNPKTIFETITVQKNLSLTYEKLSSTHYIVHVDNADKPFQLLFRQTYSPYWQASVNGQLNDGHTLEMNYANGWTFSSLGSFDIDIKFSL